MDSVDLQVLKTTSGWLKEGHGVVLGTIVETFGSSPRPPGAMLGIRDDGLVSGSVSGGCVEDDLIEKIRDNSLDISSPKMTIYGVTKEEAERYGLPCGGTLKIILEQVTPKSLVDALLTKVEKQELVTRRLKLSSGDVSLEPATPTDELTYDGVFLKSVHGPRWRLLVIGAGQLSHYIAQMAHALDYHVTVCDPRDEYANTWELDGVFVNRGMPDDVVMDMNMSSHCAVVAVTHDPKLDDLALLEALKSPAFYVGALGSRLTSKERRKRLMQFDLSEKEISRLHGPVGLRIGGKTPPEIAVSIMAEMTAVRHRTPLHTIGTAESKQVPLNDMNDNLVVHEKNYSEI